MKIKVKSAKAITYKKSFSMAMRYIRALRKTPMDSPVRPVLIDEALRYKHLALNLARSNDEFAAASQL
jgi:hypothetical protein